MKPVGKFIATALAGTALFSILFKVFRGRHSAGRLGWHRHCHSGSGEEHWRSHLRHRVGRFLSLINADETQRSQINSLVDQLFDAALNLRNDLKQKKTSFHQFWKSDPISEAEVRNSVADVMESIKRFAQVAVDAFLKLHSLLRPEQRAQFTQWHTGRCCRA